MIPSKFLRKTISKKHKINLEAYAWDKTLEKQIFAIKFKDGTNTISLKNIFKDGYNIGNCLLTSFYVFKIFPSASICTGKVDLLKGTKNSDNGDHVWLELEDTTIIDTTLMITAEKCSPLYKFYKKEETISLRIVDDVLSYQNDIYLNKYHKCSYIRGIYNINDI